MPQDLSGQRFVITAGGTREAIDPVRFLGNRATGKMGYALALAAARRGASVQLIAGPNDLPNRSGAELIGVRSAKEMHDAVLARSEEADVVIMAAAVADYRPVSPSEEKLKKSSWGDTPSIDLERTSDILATLGARRKGGKPYLVGFAAETREVGKEARKKLEEKGCDLVVANDVGRDDSGFGSEDNAVELIWQGDSRTIALASKESVAHSILDHVLLDRSGS
jgi:phosphopantothenoylcysteine decarboxylase/phosphopantothenate--cysteine ligase